MNAKMKVLALALIGLAGYAGSAVAGCPSSPVPPWSSTSVLPPSTSSFQIAAGGLDGSACKSTSSLGPSLTASATVRDDTPNAEPRYRFQFLVDGDALGTFSTTDSVVVFSAPATTATNGVPRLLRVSLVAGPGGAKRIRFIATCGSAPFTCAQSSSVDLLAGTNRVEGDYDTGAQTFRWWINAAAGTTEPAADGTIAIGDVSAWGGVDAGVLGLVAPSGSFKNNHATQPASFDTFDSRRTTYIGS